MSRLNITLPDEQIDWAKARVEAGEFESLDSYFDELAQRDRAEAEEAEWLQAAIDKGFASGVDPRPSRQIFNEIRAKYFGPNG